MRFVRDNGLSIVFLAIFLITLAGQAIAGHGSFNHDQLLHHGATISFGRYLTTSEFAADVAENWQSEYLQFTLYILATVWLVQKGSSESKTSDDVGTESDEDQKVGKYATADSPVWARIGGWRTTVYSNSLVVVMTTIWLLSWFAQSFTGQDSFNHAQAAGHADSITIWRYVTSSSYWADVLENWQSEYLQFTLYIWVTVWLVQKGSPESKPLDEAGTESDEDQKIGEHATADSPRWARVGGWRTRLYSNSLVTVMLTIWVLSWFGQGVAGRIDYNTQQIDSHEAAVGFVRYFTTSDFWNRTLQNWQSEFLAVGSMAILAVYLRQRGSPESKPVGAPHEATGVEA